MRLFNFITSKKLKVKKIKIKVNYLATGCETSPSTIPRLNQTYDLLNSNYRTDILKLYTNNPITLTLLKTQHLRFIRKQTSINIKKYLLSKIYTSIRYLRKVVFEFEFQSVHKLYINGIG